MSDPHHLRRVQLIRKAALLFALIATCALAAISKTLVSARWLHDGVEAVGLAMIVICVVGRAWCSLYIGGRKKAEIVSTGPYSLCRNPLYLFSFIGAFGMGAQTGSLVIAGLFLIIAVAVFYVTVRQEEIWLTTTFGDEYRAYCARTPRFWPRFSRWRDTETIEVRPVFFLTTLRDGLAFFLAIPIFEALEQAQAVGWVRVLFSMP
ncbi:isoprenylcysteine carboxylmethyltransferase family protein [Brevundimonas sp.]|uniref:methyltransferase family protein n=1 Tax=Brevundimonas sp. TaxID=1871086 RepID=UPI002C044B64|nr:isoprenylcysteine carboxylmethyltransferase family protein [Brevundimonas sp.]HWQ85287.1 isoprenylcysteine carboxylmethyltransferase family protein [Brevundimonas sp.]